VHRVLSDSGIDVAGAIRSTRPPSSEWCRNLKYVFNVDVEDFSSVTQAIESTRADFVINAAGVRSDDGTADGMRRLFAVNAMFPRVLGGNVEGLGIHLTHFSSDGVFSGRHGNYDELCRPDAVDPYGMSKFLGEPAGGHCLVLRTSLLGRGIQPNDSLVDWFLGQQGTVRGFRRAIFSGLPVNEIAIFLAEHVLSRPEPLTGLFHLSAAPIAKSELLNLIRSAWRRDDVQIEPDDGVAINRSLNSSALRVRTGYSPPTWPSLVEGMRSFYMRLNVDGHERV
jgi:dTDP-4-dehydrorhamnose reductase